MAVVHPAGTSGDEMSAGGRTSQTEGASLPRMQANWPTGGGVVVVVGAIVVVVVGTIVVDVVLLVVGVVVVVVVVGAIVVVVVGTIVVVVDVVLADVDTTLLVPADDWAVPEDEVLGTSHPVATRAPVMTGRVTSLVS
jgi:hypothetical protein